MCVRSVFGSGYEAASDVSSEAVGWMDVCNHEGFQKGFQKKTTKEVDRCLTTRGW